MNIPAPTLDPFHLTADEWKALLDPCLPFLPELDLARQDLAALAQSPQARHCLVRTQASLKDWEMVPDTTFTLYRRYRHTGERLPYQQPYFLKRGRLAALSLRMLLGDLSYKDAVQDYLWSICEETDWVIPAHEQWNTIDLMAAETGLLLAETVNLLGDQLDAEIRQRIRCEVARRIFDPYLRCPAMHWWYTCSNNWNGVCNSCIAAVFLWLEPDLERTARALSLTLHGLKVFVETAFEQDGSSTEGVDYWQYGLVYFVLLSEMLRARTNGAVDLLAGERMRKIAAFPTGMFLGKGKYAAFSDCDEMIRLEAGVISRLAGRSGEKSLPGLINSSLEHEGVFPSGDHPDFRLPVLLRNLLWQKDGSSKSETKGSVVFPDSGIVRLSGVLPDGKDVILVIKAGHNAENHNHNDVGSFVLAAGGEVFLTDPGKGLYSQQYFDQRRYQNIFASSYGHSVPLFNGIQQEEGRQYAGEICAVNLLDSARRTEIEFARAYPLQQLLSARRVVELCQDGSVLFEDSFRLSDAAVIIEEVYVTWLLVSLNRNAALLHGMSRNLLLTIESPADADWQSLRLEEESRSNARKGVLTRLSFTLPRGAQPRVRIKMQFVNDQNESLPRENILI